MREDLVKVMGLSGRVLSYPTVGLGVNVNTYGYFLEFLEVWRRIFGM
jgi:hypothetical protein